MIGLSEMKNKLIALFIVLIMIMVGIVFVVLFFPQVRNRFDKGDKITVDVNILLNEKEVVLSDLNATCIYENSVSCDVYSKDGRYSTKGGEYGLYSFEVIIPKEQLEGYDQDLTLKLNYINANDWNISETTCNINLVSNTKGNLVGTYYLDTIYNNKDNVKQENEIVIDDGILELNWGI